MPSGGAAVGTGRTITVFRPRPAHNTTRQSRVASRCAELLVESPMPTPQGAAAPTTVSAAGGAKDNVLPGPASSSGDPLLTPLLADPLYYNFNYILDKRYILWYGIALKWCFKYCKYLCRHAEFTGTSSVADPYYSIQYFSFVCNDRCNDACTDYYEAVYLVEWSNADRERCALVWRTRTGKEGIHPARHGIVCFAMLGPYAISPVTFYEADFMGVTQVTRGQQQWRAEALQGG
ncbi:hypothetical protein JKP88DRAFT_247031 [Tribonema minus]|uniref:Uncharacterized protein n=1 Tax=Tribonema minus TaxID=303371 RepID=A0A836CBE8_9STRA|nr:hypothetical protein JKP88DRAFT_247031 [Tribonema minus]